ncbi:MAG: efflux RND transporter periplasmic adaptor subunit [Vicinamibacterales bacterium]
MLLGCLALMAAAGCDHKEEEKREEKATYPVTSPVRQDTAITREYVAQIRAIQHIEVRAQERGYLEEIFVDEGQTVKAGEKMFQIMPRLYQAELQKAEAEVQFAQIEYQNTKVLADGKVVSPNELALAKAKMDKAQAEVALAKVHRDLTEIRAPFTGIMGRFQVRLGSLLDEGELLTTLSDNNTAWVYFNVSEPEYLEFKARNEGRGIPVTLVLANGRTYDRPGTVETIEADFNNETGNIAFRAAFPNPKGILRHGETGKVVITTPLKHALVIPQKATFETMDKRYVYVVDDHNVVRQRQITVAHELPHLYVVADGLTDTDRVLLDGLRKVREGHEILVDVQPPDKVLASLDVPAE